jgi:hypothetical protein
MYANVRKYDVAPGRVEEFMHRWTLGSLPS